MGSMNNTLQPLLVIIVNKKRLPHLMGSLLNFFSLN